jgi:hypothetical protein
MKNKHKDEEQKTMANIGKQNPLVESGAHSFPDHTKQQKSQEQSPAKQRA